MTSAKFRFEPARVGVKLATAFVLGTLLIIYVPVSPVSTALIAVFAAGTLLVDYRKVLAATLSLAFVTLVMEGAVRLGGFSALRPYFRPHEMLALETSYRPNERVEMAVPHGDLLMIDPSLPRSLAQPRKEMFATDAYGYRNDEGYSDQKLILVGDSFLVGTETFLASQLRGRHHIPAYNVSFSGLGPLVYPEKVRWARSLAPDCCVVLFLFEGNDFQLVTTAEVAARDRVPQGLQQLAKQYTRLVRNHSEWSKTFYGLLTRSRERLRPKGHDGSAGAAASTRPTTFVRTVGGKPMAFLGGYSDVAHRSGFDDHGFVHDRIAEAAPDLLVFIPDKYRIYAPLFDDGAIDNLPHAQWNYLQTAAADLGVPALDLTPHLVRRSRELLAGGEVTYWRDDTHWNQHGEAVAIEALKSALTQSGRGICARLVTESPLAASR